MKNSIKLMATAIVAVSVMFGTSAKAQTTTPSPWRFGIGVEGGVPTGTVHTVSNIELGGTARLQYGADKGLAYTLTSGYYNFFGKEYGNAGGKYGSIGLVPVKIGIKAYFVPSWYFGAEGGAAFETRNGNNTKLDLSPGLGYSTKTIDIGARYENFSGQSNNYGLVSLRVAYGFGL